MPTDEINALYNASVHTLSAILETRQIAIQSLLRALEIDLAKDTAPLRDPEQPLAPLLSEYPTKET